MFGDDRPFVAAIVAIDRDDGRQLGRAPRPRLYLVPGSERQPPEVRALIRDEIRKCNAGLPEATRIRRFLLLNKEFDADDDEITRTRKIRRRFVAEKYAAVIEALYGGRPRSSSAPRSPTRTAASRRSASQRGDRERRRGAARRAYASRRMPDFEWQFTLVLLTNGVMIGLMYALIALGFVLIYKATDAINFAQGEFVMFAGFIAAAAAAAGAPFWVWALLAIAGMVALGFGLERVVLRPLIGRPVIAVVMATIGLAAVLRGVATLVFGAGTRAIVMPVGDEPIESRPGHAAAGAAGRRRRQPRLSRRLSPGSS